MPSKLKNFLWRLCHESLPTADLLNHRSMSTTNVCGLCAAQDRHALIDCVMARSVWSLSSKELVESMCENLSMNAKTWVFTMHDILEHNEFTRMVVTLWAIWRARRKVIHEEIYESPLSTNSFINFYLKELKLVAKPCQPLVRTTTHRQSAWLPPLPGYAKVNVDAAVGRGRRHGSVAAISRDSTANFWEHRLWFFQALPIRPLLNAWR